MRDGGGMRTIPTQWTWRLLHDPTEPVKLGNCPGRVLTYRKLLPVVERLDVVLRCRYGLHAPGQGECGGTEGPQNLSHAGSAPTHLRAWLMGYFKRWRGQPWCSRFKLYRYKYRAYSMVAFMIIFGIMKLLHVFISEPVQMRCQIDYRM